MVHVWTENPLTEIWHQLGYLERPANVLSLLSGDTKSKREESWPRSEETERKAHEIASCLRQAHEYFDSSERVGLATRPLLQFYGAQSLAKALILASDWDAALSGLRYHGLSTRPWTASVSEQQRVLHNYCENPGAWEIEKEFAISHDGVFRELAKAAVDSCPGKGVVLFLKDLLRIIPELSDLYARHYGETSHCFYLCRDPQVDNKSKFSVELSAREGLNSIVTVFPELGQGYDQYERRGHFGFRSQETVKHVPDFARTIKATVAGTYYVRPHPCGICQPLMTLYAALFILSNVVRYKPSFWMRVIEGHETGSASVVEAFCNLVRRRFPGDVLEGIWRERFSFGAPGYLT